MAGTRIHLLLLRRGLRRGHRRPTASVSPACAATPLTRPTSAGCAPRARRSHRTRGAAAHARSSRAAPAHRATPRARRAGTRRSTMLADAVRRRPSREHGPDAVGVLHLRPAAHRGLLRLQQARQGPGRHQQHRHQFAAVHVVGGRGLQAARSAPTRRPPATRTSIAPTASSSPAPTRRGRIPILFRRIEDARAREPGAEADRRRSAPHRYRGGGRPAPADRAGHRRRAVQRHAARHARRGTGSIARTSTRTPRDSRRSARSLRECTPRAAAAICGVDGRGNRRRRRAGSRGAGATLSLYCQGLNQSTSGSAQERGAHQPASRDRPDRQAGRRAVLAHRPAQRDGRARGRRHGEPAVRAPRPGRSRASRAKWRALWGVAERPGAARQDRRGNVRGRRPRRDQGDLDRLHQPRAIAARPEPPCARRSSAPSSSWCRRPSRDTETAAFADVLLPAAGWGEKEGTVTNSERRISRVRAAVPPPGEARADWADRRRFRAPAGRARWPAPSRTAVPVRPAEAIFNEHRETTRGRDLDISGLSYAAAGARRPAAVAVPARRRARAGTACTRTACSRRRPAGRASSPTAYVGAAEPPMREYPLAPQHRAAARPVAQDEPHRHRRRGSSATRPSRRWRCIRTIWPRRGLRDGDSCASRAAAANRRAAAAAPSADMRQRHAFIAMHWGSRS